MLTIIKEDLNDNLRAFLEKEGIKESLENKIIMTARDGEEYLGLGTLELCRGKVYLNFLYTKEDDLILKLGIIKSLLNLADLRGIKTVYGNNEELESLYKMTRFNEENGEYDLSLEGYFSSEC